ncbi:MAG TPA: STAS domain-containing protein [Ornithinibacter sp.]|nr:STAS domain-containing protein [Ornithinibacter sp.]
MGTVVATPLWSRTVSCATLRARHRDGRPWVLELSGEADIATLEMLRRELELLTTLGHTTAEVDVTDLTFCDVASAHLLLTARRRVPLVLTGAAGSVRRLFDLLDVLQAQRLPMYRSLARPGGLPMRPGAFA